MVLNLFKELKDTIEKKLEKKKGKKCLTNRENMSKERDIIYFLKSINSVAKSTITEIKKFTREMGRQDCERKVLYTFLHNRY